MTCDKFRSVSMNNVIAKYQYVNGKNNMDIYLKVDCFNKFLMQLGFTNTNSQTKTTVGGLDSAAFHRIIVFLTYDLE